MKIVNCTPHRVCITGGECYEPSGMKARVFKRLKQTNDHVYMDVGEKVNGLPDPVPGTYYIVSRLVYESVPDRKDVICAVTDRSKDDKDKVVRNEHGKIVSVPGFVYRCKEFSLEKGRS